MTPELFLRTAIAPALSLLPSQMDSAEARALIVAIALQESGLNARHQYNGPAVSYLQFERGGIKGVLEHPASTLKATALCQALDIPPTVDGVYDAIEYQDVLAVGFARLLLWQSSTALPASNLPGIGWQLYTDLWRPGKPHDYTWPAKFTAAWTAVLHGKQIETLKA